MIYRTSYSRTSALFRRYRLATANAPTTDNTASKLPGSGTAVTLPNVPNKVGSPPSRFAMIPAKPEEYAVSAACIDVSKLPEELKT